MFFYNQNNITWSAQGCHFLRHFTTLRLSVRVLRFIFHLYAGEQPFSSCNNVSQLSYTTITNLIPTTRAPIFGCVTIARSLKTQYWGWPFGLPLCLNIRHLDGIRFPALDWWHWSVAWKYKIKITNNNKETRQCLGFLFFFPFYLNWWSLDQDSIRDGQFSKNITVYVYFPKNDPFSI